MTHLKFLVSKENKTVLAYMQLYLQYAKKNK